MDHLRDGIWTMGYGERNPLVEYKIEGSRIFSNMLLNMKEEIIEYMMKVEVRKVEVDDTPQNDIPFKNAEVFHPEVDQFGTGGIPAGLSLKAKNTTEEKSTEGGVKRKKTRRSRR
jgi:preprotein translocase subunit SecA